MRAQVLTSILVCLFLITGCSKDDINDTPDTQATTLNLEDKGGILQIPEIHFTETGDFEIYQSPKCGKSGMIHSIGFIDMGKKGKFLTEYYNCANSDNYNSIEAVFTDMEGDQLFLVSTKKGFDSNGNLEYQVQVTGGNGKYENAVGQISFTNVKTFETKEAGYYVNTAKGNLLY